MVRGGNAVLSNAKAACRNNTVRRVWRGKPDGRGGRNEKTVRASRRKC